MLLCESLIEAKTTYTDEVYEDLRNCTAAELRLVSELIPTILAAFRRANSIDDSLTEV